MQKPRAGSYTQAEDGCQQPVPSLTGGHIHVLPSLIKCKKGDILFLHKPNQLITEHWLSSGSGYSMHSTIDQGSTHIFIHFICLSHTDFVPSHKAFVDAVTW